MSFTLPATLINMHKHTSPRSWSWHIQLQPDAVANELQVEAEVGKAQAGVFKPLELYISQLDLLISSHTHLTIIMQAPHAVMHF